jgi:protocatechuate 3,4-dioxygenase beta subunit
VEGGMAGMMVRSNPEFGSCMSNRIFSRFCAFVLLVLAILSTAVSAQEQGRQGAFVQGTVTKAASGEPLRGAVVELESRDAGGVSYRTLSDASGKFSITSVNPGNYELSARHNGYATQSYAANGSAGMSIRAGQQVKDILFRLPEPAAISGKVTDENGEALADAQIQAMTRRKVRGASRLAPVATAKSDDRGEFRIAGLYPGTYVVKVTAEDPASLDVAGKYVDQVAFPGYVPTFYPNSPEIQQAIPIELKWGQEVPISVSVAAVATFDVSGRVMGNSGGVPSVMLKPAHSFGSLQTYEATIGTGGRFTFQHVVPGDYVLSALTRSTGAPYSARMPIQVGAADVSGITLNMEPPSKLSGRVVFESALKPPINMALQLVPSDDDEIGAFIAQVGADGSFSIPNVPPGPYTVSMTALPDEYYVKSVTLGRDDVTHGIQLTREAASQPLQVTLSPAGGRIEGAVTDVNNKSVGGAQVALLAEAGNAPADSGLDYTVTDQQGRFVLHGVRPGSYRILAWQSSTPNAPADTQSAQQMIDSGKPLKVDPNGVYEISVTALPRTDMGQ